LTGSLLALLQDQIDITRVPFSDRGSRLLVFKQADESRLYVRLAERLIRLEPGLDAYLLRPAFIPALYLIDGRGNPLEFAISTSAERVDFWTAIGLFSLVFQDMETLAFGLPANTSSGLRFTVGTELHRTTATGGTLKHVRNLAYQTNGEIAKNQVLVDQQERTVEFIVRAGDDTAITVHITDRENPAPRCLSFSEARRNAEARWQSWYGRVPPVAQPYQKKYAYAWWVMANNLVSPLGCLGYEAMMPSKAFYLGVWLWDSALHAIAYRHAQPELARDQLRVLLAHQLPDGMLPDAVFDEGVVTEIDHPFPARVTKPPILAWAALKLHETNPDIDFLREIYPALARWNDWWFNCNDDDADGLVQYTHPYSSGLDNSPLWDHGMPVESPDINTYLNIQMKALAGMAEILGDTEAASAWRRRAEALTQRMIQDLRDEQAGLFRALHAEKPIPVITPFNLYPLWTAELPASIAGRLISHLTDPHEFGGEHMIPTVARSDPAYEPDNMWRGPIWANINYFFVEALKEVGETRLARDLRRKTLDLISSQPGMHEYYHPDTGQPASKAAPMFGWTAAVFIELALQASADAASGKA